eukprot:scaffold7155_cov119-Amphora_coffeaeformis.AAC.1
MDPSQTIQVMTETVVNPGLAQSPTFFGPFPVLANYTLRDSDRPLRASCTSWTRPIIVPQGRGDKEPSEAPFHMKVESRAPRGARNHYLLGPCPRAP